MFPFVRNVPEKAAVHAEHNQPRTPMRSGLNRQTLAAFIIKTQMGQKVKMEMD